MAFAILPEGDWHTYVPDDRVFMDETSAVNAADVVATETNRTYCVITWSLKGERELVRTVHPGKPWCAR